jgi:hypothetical protein
LTKQSLRKESVTAFQFHPIHLPIAIAIAIAVEFKATATAFAAAPTTQSYTTAANQQINS